MTNSRTSKTGRSAWPIAPLALTLSVALVAALSLLSPASATGSSGASVSAPSSIAAKALPTRNLHDKLKQKPRGLFIKGNVSPGYGHKKIVIQKAKCKTCAFKKVAKVRTNKAGKWSYKLSAPANGYWYWKAFAKKSGNYGKSPSNNIYKTWR